MQTYVLAIHDVDRTQIPDVGGKGASLGELSRLAGVFVPAAFCVTTAAYERTLGTALDASLARLQAGDLNLSAAIRTRIAAIPIPEDVQAAILARLDPHAVYAVRSSATAGLLRGAARHRLERHGRSGCVAPDQPVLGVARRA